MRELQPMAELDQVFRRGWVGTIRADEWATACGLHPRHVWPEWDGPVVEEPVMGRRQGAWLLELSAKEADRAFSLAALDARQLALVRGRRRGATFADLGRHLGVSRQRAQRLYVAAVEQVEDGEHETAMAEFLARFWAFFGSGEGELTDERPVSRASVDVRS